MALNPEFVIPAVILRVALPDPASSLLHDVKAIVIAISISVKSEFFISIKF